MLGLRQRGHSFCFRTLPTIRFIHHRRRPIAHPLSTLLVAFGGVLAGRLRFLGRLAHYLSTFALSFSFLLSLVPGINETLTRVPVGRPIAAAPLAPVVLQVLLGCAVVFVIGFAAQCWRIRSRNKHARA